MKTKLLWIAPLAILCQTLGAQIPSDQLIEAQRGPHHKTWLRVTATRASNGELFYQTNSSHIEWATGMHYFEDQWKEAREEIELFPLGAIARSGAHQVIFSPDLGQSPTIDLLTPDQKRIEIQCLGLSYYDVASGQSVMIAPLKESGGGELHPPRQVIYPDAFDDINASLRYTYTRAGIEQDVVLLSALPSPALWNFNPATTRLEVWSEFETDAQVQLQSRPFQDYEDDFVSLGQMHIGSGKAFALDNDPGKERALSVARTWISAEGRRFLVESLAYERIRPELERLPAPDQQAAARPASQGRLAVIESGPRRQAAAAKEAKGPIRMASAPLKGPGFVVDWTLVSGGASLTNQANSTYLVSGPVVITNLVVEGGSVVKFTNNASIEVAGTIRCDTGPYFPAIFTAWNDPTVGQVIGAGPPTSYCADPFLKLPPITNTLAHLRFSHAKKAISQDSGEVILRNCQITHCEKGLVVGSATATLENVLAYAVTNLVSGNNHSLRAQHLTLNRCGFLSSPTDIGSGTLTNSILLNVTNWGNASFTTNAVLKTSDETIFQKLGAGFHYHAQGSPAKDAGTTNLSAGLLEALRSKTVCPPAVMESPVTLDQVWGARALRDLGPPDLGYHYEICDYACRDVTISNAWLLLTNGAVVAAFGLRAFVVSDGGEFLSQGTPRKPNVLTYYNTLQEQTTNWGSGLAGSDILISSYNSGVLPPEVRLRFTHSYLLNAQGYHTYADAYGAPDLSFSELELKDCMLYGGALSLWDTNGAVLGITNSILRALDLSTLKMGHKYYAINNLLRQVSGIAWWELSLNGTNVYANNFFDCLTHENYDEQLSHQYNGYFNAQSFYSVFPTNASERVLSTHAYETGALGGFYYSTNSPLTDAGGSAAHLLGLYHYTTSVGNEKEAQTDVNLGFHFVAWDSATGAPRDEDEDGMADHQEDVDGDGVFDSGQGETDWQNYDSALGVGAGPGLVLFHPLQH